MRTPKPYARQDGTTTWRVAYRVPPRSGRKDGQGTATFDTEAEALAFAREVDVLGVNGALDRLEGPVRPEPAVIPTLNEIAADHFRLKTDVTAGTRLKDTRTWGFTWGPLIGHLPADVITRDVVREATLVLSPRYAYKSMKNHRGLLHGVCARAVELDYLRSVPTKGVKLNRTRAAEPKMRFLSTEEVYALVEHTHPHYRPYLRFLVDTGCRQGEARALMVGAVNLDTDAPYVHIRQAWQSSPDNALTLGPPKTAAGDRILYLTDELIADLRPLCAGRDRDAMVFTAPRGGVIHQRTWYSDIWHPTLKAAGIAAPRPRPHDLRHSFASRQLAAGTRMEVLQRLMGHESIVTTVDRYGDVDPRNIREAMEAMQRVSKPGLRIVREAG